MDFAEKVYIETRKVPKGRVTTYKEIAKALGTKAYRAVGTALNRNPYAPEVPCHRVVNSDGRVGGFARGEMAKARMLRKEGVFVKNHKIINFGKIFYKL